MSQATGPTSAGYWDERYRSEGPIWGREPSLSARWAGRHFQREGSRSVLVAGCGYGRNLGWMAGLGFTRLEGLDISPEAVDQARRALPGVTVHCANLLEWAPEGTPFDALYAGNLLHFFLEGGRRTFAATTRRLLRANGLLALSVFSTREKACGTGRELEPDTWESKPGRPAHYFRPGEPALCFPGFTLVEEIPVEEPEDHGSEGPHCHHLILALLRRDPTP